MAEQEPQSRSLRDYAEFELERRGYDRAQVDAFLAELDQAFVELEKSVKERGNEVAELQREVERLKRDSPKGKAEEILRRAEENAEQMLTSAIAESQKIITNAETMAMRIIANARAQSQEIAQQPAGFGMLARVRTIAADIDRIKAEHAALMEDEPELLVSDPAEALEAEVVGDPPSAAEEAEVEEESLVEEPTPEDAPGPAAEADVSEEIPPAPRIQLVQPPPLEAVLTGDEHDVDDEDIILDAKNFDWSAAREHALHVMGEDEPHEIDEPAEEVAEEMAEHAQVGDAEDVEDEAHDESLDDELPTIMRREGSRYERHSASLPKRQDDGSESTLSNVSKVSKRRRRRTATHDDN